MRITLDKEAIKYGNKIIIEPYTDLDHRPMVQCGLFKIEFSKYSCIEVSLNRKEAIGYDMQIIDINAKAVRTLAMSLYSIVNQMSGKIVLISKDVFTRKVEYYLEELVRIYHLFIGKNLAQPIDTLSFYNDTNGNVRFSFVGMNNVLGKSAFTVSNNTLPNRKYYKSLSNEYFYYWDNPRYTNPKTNYLPIAEDIAENKVLR